MPEPLFSHADKIVDENSNKLQVRWTGVIFIITLSQIKKRQTSSDPEIPPRLRPVEIEFQAAIEAERGKTQAAFEERDRQLAERDRQAAERDRENEERTARLLEEERNRNDSANRAMYDLFVSMCEKNGQTPPSMPVIAPRKNIDTVKTKLPLRKHKKGNANANKKRKSERDNAKTHKMTRHNIKNNNDMKLKHLRYVPSENQVKP
ncbi:uncharacterized protein LOC119350071 [Triticum dicoccoides]|uniref:uncharacterized protein LOC119350071 n=1 Tax=Triticum dicoccoides TaxID=85692 RepID=UPI00188F085D|nr:uncharacterized protein LOC119350071 [Triticum dicoccoides]